MYEVIEFSAVVAGAVYGVILTRRHHMDSVGVFCLAFVVAFGGGTLRDLLLDRHPLFWIREAHYPVIVFVIALATSLIKHMPRRTEGILSVPDALGRGLFSVAGTNAALESGTSLFVASLMGVVAGTFGGVVGDVICNRIPSLFRPAPMFATCSFAGSWVFLILNEQGISQSIAAPAGIAVVVAFRLLAIGFDWRLPNVEDFDDQSTDSPA